MECQVELAREAAATEMWRPAEPGRLTVAAVFCAFPTGHAGPGAAGDPAWAAAVLWAGEEGASADAMTGARTRRPAGRLLAEAVISGAAGARYEAGLLGLRAGPLLERAVRALVPDQSSDADGTGVHAGAVPDPDFVLVDATGLDHPRGAGLALHLGALLGLPSVGVTNRVLVAEAQTPDAVPGAVAPLLLDGRLVGYVLRARARANPLLIHAGWRTDPATALAVVRPLVGAQRTPEPLRLARHAARVARARAEGRYPA